MRTCANLHNINASLSNILSWSVSAKSCCPCVEITCLSPPSQWTVKDAPVRPTAFPSSPSVTQTQMMDYVSSSLIKVPLVPSRSSVYHLRSRSKCDSFFFTSLVRWDPNYYQLLCDRNSDFLIFLPGLCSDILPMHQHFAQLPFSVLKRRYMFVQLWRIPIINVTIGAR